MTTTDSSSAVTGLVECLISTTTRRREPNRSNSWTVRLGIAQQQVASYEVARLRIPASMLPKLARVFGITIEALIGEEEKPAKRGPTPKLQRHMERISQLPKPKQRFVMEMLETVLAQASR